MNSVDPSYNGFKGLLPVLFSQVVDGEPEHRYKMKEGGHITVTLIDSSSDFYSPKITSSGSLDVSYTAYSVQQFFRNVQLNDFFNVEGIVIKKALKATFSQILSGEHYHEMIVEGHLKVAVKLNHGYLYRGTVAVSSLEVEKVVAEGSGKGSEYEVKNGSEDDKPALEVEEGVKSTLDKLLLTPNIFTYFSHLK